MLLYVELFRSLVSKYDAQLFPPILSFFIEKGPYKMSVKRLSFSPFSSVPLVALFYSGVNVFPPE